MRRMIRSMVFAAFFVACLAGTASAQVETLKIGVSVPLAGALALYGQGGVNAIKMAVRDINASGGLRVGGKTYRLEAVIYDDRNDPKESASIMERLVARDKVRAVLGSVGTSCSIAMSEVADRVKIVVISPYNSGMKATQSGFKYYFRGAPAQIQEWAIMPKYWIRQGWKTAAFLAINDDNGRGNAEGLAKTLEAIGGKALGFEWYTYKDVDMYTQLKKIKEMKPDVLSITATTQQLSLIIRQAKEVWPEARILSSGGQDANRLLELAGSATEGLFFTTPEPPQTPQTIAFDKEYENLFGVAPFWGYSKSAYDSTMILAKAFERAGKIDDPEALRDAMRATDYYGLVGHFRFDETGNNSLPWYYGRFEKGKVIIFDPRK